MYRRPPETPHPLWDALPFVQRQSFSWVAKDNEVVTLDWGRKSLVFLCRAFMLQTINMVTLSACYAEEKQEQALLSQCPSPLLTRHSLSENTWGQVITQIYIVAALMGRRAKNKTVERGLIMARSHAAQALHSLKACSRTQAKKQTEKRHDKVKLMFMTFSVQNLSAGGCRKTGRGRAAPTECSKSVSERCYERRHYTRPSNGSMLLW